jgi:hypothetical protein
MERVEKGLKRVGGGENAKGVTRARRMVDGSWSYG